MRNEFLKKPGVLCMARQFASMSFLGALCAVGACAQFAFPFLPGNLVVSRSVYDNNPANVQVGMTLPPNCQNSCVQAVTDGTYPFVFNNAPVDGSFGITSKIFLDQMTPFGFTISSLEVPNNTTPGFFNGQGTMVTSFSSKSELALNLSTDGQYLTFMGYASPIDAIDVSNANTPAVVDPSNPVGENVYRVVAQVDAFGRFSFTETNAYSGNNGRAAILNNAKGANVIYMSGNAGNGGSPQPNGILIAAGAQIATPAGKPESQQSPALPTPVASFNITQLGDKADKIGKDDNFRGLSIFDNVLYLTKGSGGNGVNTVYFVDTTATVCTDANGVGLPASGAALPTSPLAYNTNPTVLQAKGLDPNNMCVLNGFPTALKSKTSFPFGVWFANATTLYVADEGNGNTGTTVAGFYAPAAAQTTAGLEKWTLVNGVWQLAYTLTAGLNLGMPYIVPGYPTGNNDGTGGTGFPWAPATDGLRNLTGVVNRNGTATIYAITSTISGSGDQGADPNNLVVITDEISAVGPNPPANESFQTLRTARSGEVLRGVSFTPRIDIDIF